MSAWFRPPGRFFAFAIPAILLIVRWLSAAEPSPAELYDRAVANAEGRVIRNGIVELEERVSVPGQKAIPIQRRIVVDGSFTGGRFRDDQSMQPEAPPSTMMRCGLPPNYLTLTADPARGDVRLTSHPWIPARFGEFGRLGANSFRSGETPTNFLTEFTRTVRLVGKEDFEGSQVQVIEASFVGGLKRKAWIDPTRGFICSRQEYYQNDALVSKTESWGFFVVGSGKLYFPEFYRDMLIDRKTGNPQVEWNYHVDPKTVELNVTVSEDEFLVTMPAGATLKDERPGGRDYRATAELSFEFNESLEPGSLAGLQAMGPPRPKPPAPAAALQIGRLGTIFIVAVACVLPVALIAVIVLVHRVSRPRLIEAEAIEE